MTNSQRLATVRAHLRRWLQENVTSSLSETNVEMPAAFESVEEDDLTQTADKRESTSESDEHQNDATELTTELTTDLTTELTTELTDSTPEIVAESILIRDGFYAGRTFVATAQGETFRGTWFMEPDELKIHAAGGALVAVFQGDEIRSDRLEDPAVPAEQGPISIPMPAADKTARPENDSDSGDDDRIQKAA